MQGKKHRKKRYRFGGEKITPLPPNVGKMQLFFTQTLPNIDVPVVICLAKMNQASSSLDHPNIDLENLLFQ